MSSFFYRARFTGDHRWAPERMSDYLDDELASSGRARLERHISQCEECRRLLYGLRRMLEALHRLPAPSGNADPVRIAASVRVQLKEAE